MLAFLVLLVAIAVEVASTAALPRARGFTDPGWSIAVASGYVLSVWLLTIVVRWMEVSIAYALWAGLGTAAIVVVGWLFLGEPLGALKLVGIGLIVAGVVLLNLHGASH